MIAVLDTHSWIWFLDADPRLGQRARAEIVDAITRGEAFVSAITLWEVAMFVARGRLSLNRPLRDWFELHLRHGGFHLQPITPAIAVESGYLPGDPHGDPADRLIIGTTRHLGATLVTADGMILSYAQGGHVSVVDARG